MKLKSAEAIADAVLFEGYILYPYRPSSIKNQKRWNFGTLYPRCFAEAQQPPERWRFRAQVLVEMQASSQLSACLRFLQLVPPADNDEHSWSEGFVRSRATETLSLDTLGEGTSLDLDLTKLAAAETRTPETFQEKFRNGRLHLKTERIAEGIYRLTAEVENLSPNAAHLSRREAEDVSFTSAHLILNVAGGSFVSLLEPPPELALAVKDCMQDGVFPVLVRDEENHSSMLCSPIILYDYPEIAPESAGNFFDSTEMDEMLALRVLTLSDAEKDEMRCGDPHAQEILERTETLSNDQLARVHGAVRGLRRITGEAFVDSDALDLIEQPFNPRAEDPFAEHVPVTSVRVFGVDVHVGDRIRLWPQKKADILDIAMEGKVAMVEAIEQDLENNIQFAVVLDDDPGRDMGMQRQAGHRFFFTPEEIEPVGMESPR